jgi:hypothetical protein
MVRVTGYFLLGFPALFLFNAFGGRFTLFKHLSNILTHSLGAVVALLVGFLMIATVVGLVFLPLREDNMSIDLGIVIVKSWFVKFLGFAIGAVMVGWAIKALLERWKGKS